MKSPVRESGIGLFSWGLHGAFESSFSLHERACYGSGPRFESGSTAHDVVPGCLLFFDLT
jgi:hypothetical protein